MTREYNYRDEQYDDRHHRNSQYGNSGQPERRRPNPYPQDRNYGAPYDGNAGSYYNEGSPSGRMSGKGPGHDERSSYRRAYNDYNPGNFNNPGHDRRYWEENRNPQYPRDDNRRDDYRQGNYDNNVDLSSPEPDPHYRRAHNFSSFNPDGGYGYASGGYGPPYARSGNEYMTREEIEYERRHQHNGNRGFFGKIWDAVTDHPDDNRTYLRNQGRDNYNDNRNNDPNRQGYGDGNQRWNEDQRYNDYRNR